MDKYDYIEMVIFDIHSVPKGKVIARRRIMSALKKGIGLYSAMCYFGIQHQPNGNDYFGAERNYGNGYLIPIVDTLVDAPKSACGEYKVGQVLCDLHLLDGSLEPSTPRHVAKRQVEQLASRGFTIKSSHELEFGIYDKDGQPWGHDSHWCDMTVLGDKQQVLFGFMDELASSGVLCDALQPEAGPGQYEFNMDIAEGLKGPDMTSRFKNVSKIYFGKRNAQVTYMTKVKPDICSNGFHFNFSLWTSNGQNAFLDTDQPDRLSMIGRQFLAGLISHSRALTALFCPTTNCYRRLFFPWTPSTCNWGHQDRLASYRVVTESDNNIYIECRIPSSASNAYAVLAGIIAAGLDGLTRQLSLNDVNTTAPLPRSLEEALRCLEDDSVLVESLGKEFVDCFAYVKRTYEIEHFNDMSDERLFEEERNVYFTAA